MAVSLTILSSLEEINIGFMKTGTLLSTLFKGYLNIYNPFYIRLFRFISMKNFTLMFNCILFP